MSPRKVARKDRQKRELLLELDGGVSIALEAPDERAMGFFEDERHATVIHARGPDGALVGRIWIEPWEMDKELPGDEDDEFYEPPIAAIPCIEAYLALKARHKGLDGVMRVRWAEVIGDAYRRKGVGAALYVGAAMVARKYRSALIADDCYYDSSTSDSAHNVWAGRTLRRYCDVEKNAVCYFTGSRMAR